MDSLDPLAPSSSNIYVGVACISSGNAVGELYNPKQFNGLHNEARVSRGAGSHRRANVEKRVASIKHSLLFHMIAKHDGNLQVVSLTSQGSAVCLPSLECSLYHLACSMFILVTQCTVLYY